MALRHRQYQVVWTHPPMLCLRTELKPCWAPESLVRDDKKSALRLTVTDSQIEHKQIFLRQFVCSFSMLVLVRANSASFQGFACWGHARVETARRNPDAGDDVVEVAGVESEFSQQWKKVGLNIFKCWVTWYFTHYSTSPNNIEFSLRKLIKHDLLGSAGAVHRVELCEGSEGRSLRLSGHAHTFHSHEGVRSFWSKQLW